MKLRHFFAVMAVIMLPIAFLLAAWGELWSATTCLAAAAMLIYAAIEMLPDQTEDDR